MGSVKKIEKILEEAIEGETKMSLSVSSKDDFNSHMQGSGTNRDLIIDAINNERTYELNFINENIKIGSTDPYNPYTVGSPAICAYPIPIGIDIAAIIIPTKISLDTVFTLSSVFILSSFYIIYNLYIVTRKWLF